jgi:biopolymer transport protein ExbD
MMKSRTQTTAPQSRYSISITPLIDVIFLLMIFFLLTMSFQKPEDVLENRLPQLGSQDSSDPAKDWETVRLRIKMVKEDNRMKIFLGERVVFTYKDLLYYLDQLPEDILIMMDPDRDVPYKHVIGVYNSCLKSRKRDIVFSLSMP